MTITHPLFRAGRCRCILALLLLLITVACNRTEAVKPPAPQAKAPTASDPSPVATSAGGMITRYAVTGEPLGEGIFVGAPKHYDNLTIFPILAKSQTDVGPLVSLHDALKAGTAEVREIGSVPEQAQSRGDHDVEQSNRPQQRIVRTGHGAGAQVNKLVIENKGDRPVYVLAGTIVKGGNQDRQVGQDFIIGSRETTPIDAFCVEHGRWNGQRDGKATGGKFEAVAQLANRDVRAAGQLNKDQSKVWSKVSEINAANDKKSRSDSLLASADDAALKKRRDALGRHILADLDRVEPAGAVVGYAYAIDGKVEGARWFAHHRVFGMFRQVLVNTAVADAVTAKARATKRATAQATAASVVSFVTETEKAAAAAAPEVRATEADNVNEYVETKKSYRSTTVFEGKKVNGKPKPKVRMSVDYTAL